MKFQRKNPAAFKDANQTHKNSNGQTYKSTNKQKKTGSRRTKGSEYLFLVGVVCSPRSSSVRVQPIELLQPEHVDGALHFRTHFTLDGPASHTTYHQHALANSQLNGLYMGMHKFVNIFQHIACYECQNRGGDALKTDGCNGPTPLPHNFSSMIARL